MVPASHSFRGPGDRSARRESRIHRFFPAGKRERCLPLPACFRHLRLGRRGAFLETRKNQNRKSTRLNSSHTVISYAVFCLKKKKQRKAQFSCCWIHYRYRATILN